ncbi:MAG: hypothetical protein GDA50_06395 [Alphaproteobacteria bacterium GM202ARS2]|nr:hypothetical protein [Alphaproteobacteria bacterium GM202ARS2]
MDELESFLRRTSASRDSLNVFLGNTTACLVTSASASAARGFFSSRAVLDPHAPTEFELWCIDDTEGIVREHIADYPPDPSYRAGAFAMGYFATDHFGAPVVLHRFGRRYYMVGVELERPTWTYFVKFFVFTAALEKQQLFLKSAAVEIDGQGVLIAGRGGGGKTTLVETLCRYGARFLTNSHAIVSNGEVIGVPSNMRVRPNDTAADHAPKLPSLREGERLRDPYTDLPAAPGMSAPLHHTLIIDYRPEQEDCVRRLPPDEAVGFLDQFSLGVNVYGLEEELLEWCGHDVARFGREMMQQWGRLRILVEEHPCYLVRTDILDPDNRAVLFDMLGIHSRLNPPNSISCRD